MFHLRRIQVETAGDAQFFGAGAEQVGGAAFAEQQAESAEQQRLAGSGFAGPGAKARLQLDANVCDDAPDSGRIVRGAYLAGWFAIRSTAQSGPRRHDSG